MKNYTEKELRTFAIYAHGMIHAALDKWGKLPISETIDLLDFAASTFSRYDEEFFSMRELEVFKTGIDTFRERFHGHPEE